MHTPHAYRRQRARCTAIRSLRSAALALAIVALPDLISFTKHGQFDLAALRELGQSLIVAALMVLFNYLQRLRAVEQPAAARPRARQRRRQGSDDHQPQP